MNRENSTRALVESGVLTGVAVILALIGIYIPIVALITSFLWPLPITLIYIRHNIKYTLISFFATGIILSVLSDPSTVIYIMALYGITSIVMGYCIKSKKPATVTILFMSITYFICLIASFYILTIFMGIDLIGLFKDAMAQSVESARNMYTSMGMSKETLEKSINQLNINTMLMMIPGTIVLASATIAYITYSTAGYIFKRFGYNLNKVKPFSEWYMPFQVAMGLILFTFLGYILNAKGVNVGESLFVNSVTIFRLAFILVGMSSAAFFLKKRGMSKGMTVVILLFAAITPLSSILELLGIFDYALDIRRLDTNRKTFVKR